MDNYWFFLIYVLVAIALDYLRQWVTAKVADSRYEQAINAVFAAVEYVNQTFVDTLKEYDDFTNHDKLEAYNRAKTAALDAMEKSTIRWIEKSFDDVDTWLKIQIESAVKAVKQDG